MRPAPVRSHPLCLPDSDGDFGQCRMALQTYVGWAIFFRRLRLEQVCMVHSESELGTLGSGIQVVGPAKKLAFRWRPQNRSSELAEIAQGLFRNKSTALFARACGHYIAPQYIA